MTRTYKIIPVGNKYQVSEANDKPLIWWESDNPPVMVEFDRFSEAADCVNVMIDNQQDHENGWEEYGERLWQC